MGVGLAPAVANALLDALGNAVNYTAPLAVWIKLHIGDPGAAGTANPAVNTTRKQASFAVAAANLLTTDTDLTWIGSEVTGSEDYSHYSAWTLVTAGVFLWSGVITANAVVTADQFKILAGDLDCSFIVAT